MDYLISKDIQFNGNKWFFETRAKGKSGYFVPMAMTEKIVLVLCLFGGFLWLRARSRAINLENQVGRAMGGVFLLLPALLIGEKYVFDHYLHLGPWTDLLIKTVVTVATFPAIGIFFLKPQTQAAAAGDGEKPSDQA
jgi:hypothetical protein